MIARQHSTMSSYREMIVEHLFVGEVLRLLWKRGCIHAEVLKPETDDAGYDVVIECNRITRHIQLKSSHREAKARKVNIHLRLGDKPCGCVLWIFFDPEELSLGPYLWFGDDPGRPLPAIRDFKVAKQTKGDATGKKSVRPHLREVPKSQFVSLSGIEEVVERLFGLLPPLELRDIDAILEFLPLLESLAGRYGEVHPAVVTQEDPKMITAGWVSLHEPVSRFLEALYDNHWVVSFDWPRWYKTAKCYERPEVLARADLEVIRRLLTVHAREEYGCNGHLLTVLESGLIAGILQRLRTIRQEMGSAQLPK